MWSPFWLSRSAFCVVVERTQLTCNGPFDEEAAGLIVGQSMKGDGSSLCGRMWTLGVEVAVEEAKRSH